MTQRISIFRRYLLYFAVVVSISIIATSAIQAVLYYQQQRQQITRFLDSESLRARDSVLSWLDGLTAQIRHHIRWTNWPFFPGGLEVTRLEYLLLLRQVPAISDLRLIDASGKERLLVSRTAIDRFDSGIDFSHHPAVNETRGDTPWYGTVEFRPHTGPSISIALRSGTGASATLTIAEINLRLLEDALQSIAQGNDGYAMLTDSNGHLLAHPDRYLVLAKTQLKHLPQVRAAINAGNNERRQQAFTAGINTGGEHVVSSRVYIAETGWWVFVEQPLSQALQPLYQGLWRIAALLMLGLLLALVAGTLLARQFSRPIQTLNKGVEAFASGQLGHRIDVTTGDELQQLAESFNRMAVQLQSSQQDLEQKIQQRTHELEAANRHKTEFLSNMSHELRTPLNAILGFSEALSLRLFGELTQKQAQYVDNIHQAGQHLLQLINDILDLSKIDTGHMQLELKPLKMDQVLSASVMLVKTTAAKRGIKLHLEVSAELGPIAADERKLKQIVVNLLANALKFTPRDGSVSLTASPWVDPHDGSKGVEIACTDTGIGIAASELDNIFDRFHQVGNGANGGAGGTGLGLGLCKRLVELHGGTLRVVSTPGVGSTFSFNLPETP